MDESIHGRYDIILGKDLLIALGLDLKVSDNVTVGSKGPYEGSSALMVDVSNYKIVSISDKTVKPEESFIYPYVNKCLKYDSAISSTQQMRKLIDAKY